MRLNLSLLAPIAVLAVAGAAGVALPHEISQPDAPVATPVVASVPEAGGPARAVDPAAVAATLRATLIETTVDALGQQVREQSDPNALRYAVRAYYNFRAAHPDEVRKPYLYYVDYGLDSRTPRGYVFDMDTRTVVDGPFTVAHGRGSSSKRDGVPLIFSNTMSSATTSLGLYVAQELYSFTGKSGGHRYHSVGLRLDGVSGQFNSAARRRGVVAHGAPYVTPTRAGRSEGCPAMEPSRAKRLLPMLSEGGLVFLYSPNDRDWLHSDPWASPATMEAARF